MNILFITTDRYPNYGTSTGIIKKLIFEGDMLRRADSITVLTEKSDINEKDMELNEGVNIVRYVSTFSMRMKCILKDKSISIVQKLCFIGKKFYIKYVNKEYKDSFIKRLHINEIYKVLLKINAEKYEVIIPIFGDYDAAMAAARYKKKYVNSHLILYQVDPFSTNWVLDKKLVNKYKKTEKKLYSLSDAIITMPCIYKDIEKISDKKDLYKFSIFELPLINKRKLDENKKRNDIPICLFSGLIYRNIRNPRYTIKLFSDLIKKNIVELWFVGVEHNELPVEFSGINIKCFGRIPITEANVLIDQADVLINIGNLMNNQVPSKIFDYISTGKPIINIYKNYDCPTLQYLNKYDLSLNLFEDDKIIDEQKNKLEIFVKNNYKKRIAFTRIEEEYKDCTPRVCADRLFSIIDTLLKNSKK